MLNRDTLIKELANYFTDGVDLDSLIQDFRESQIEWLDDMSDEDLICKAIECGFNPSDYEEE